MELKAGTSSKQHITPCTLLATKTLGPTVIPAQQTPTAHHQVWVMKVTQKKGVVKTAGFWPTATSSATLPVHLVLLLVWPLLCLLQRSLSLWCQLSQNSFVYSHSTFSRTVLHSSRSAVTRWHPTSDTRRCPAGDHHSRLFLSLINCCGLASRLSVVLSVFCPLASCHQVQQIRLTLCKSIGSTA